MENQNLRSFEIGHTTFTLEKEGTTYSLRSTGTHWAVRDTDGRWGAFKGEHFRGWLGQLEPEQVAQKLLEYDRAHREMLAGLGIDPA